MSRPAGDVRTASHGRGGAGNIGARTEETSKTSADLETPTIKSSVYTTGRGGSGNMAVNDPSKPDVARAAQDVDTPAHHAKDREGWHHWGRGGEGNLKNLGGDGPAKSRTGSKGAADRSGSFGGIVEKGKEFLGLGKKKETAAAARANESAIE